MKCDIIIPTYNNATVLLRTLSAILKQSIPDNWQVRIIISDDGSTDNTVNICHNLFKQNSWSHLIITNNHTGSAGARNRAIDALDSDIALFIGADMIMRPHTLLSHLQWHQQNPNNNQAALGFVMWHPGSIPLP